MKVLNLGLRPYTEVWELQKQLQSELIAGAGQETLIICEHTPVVTLGASAEEQNLLFPIPALNERGIEVIKVERGGDVTYHGPGQLVMYPIMDLRRRRQDVGWYIRSLEDVIIRTLAHFGITGMRVNGKPGVWTAANEEGGIFHGRKIASIGVRISRWCTMHGMALNVQGCEGGFSVINPCGFTGIEISTMKQEAGHGFETAEVGVTAARVFCDVFPELTQEEKG